MKPKIIIVDNDLVFRQSLIFLISIQNKAEVLGKASDGEGLLELLSKHKPNLILLNIDVPNLNPSEILESVSRLSPLSEVVAYGMFESKERMNELGGMGVKGFVFKSEAMRELEREIQSLRQLKENNYINNKQLSYFSRMAPGRYQVFVENLWIKNVVGHGAGGQKGVQSGRMANPSAAKCLNSNTFK